MAILVVCACKTVYSEKKRVCPKCGKAKKDRGTRYQVVIREGGRGTRKHTAYANTMAEARQVEQEIRAKLHRGVNPAAARKGITVGSVFERYLKSAQHPDTEEAKISWNKDLQRWNDYLAPDFGNRRMDAVTRDDVLDFLKKLKSQNSRLGKPLAPATRRHILVLLQRLYNWSRSAEIYFGRNPASKLTIDVHNKKGKVFKPEQATEVLAAFEELASSGKTLTERMCGLALMFCLLTGRRRGEVSALEWETVDLDTGMMTAMKTKSGEDVTVPIEAEVVKILRRAKDMGLDGASLVFHQSDGKSLYNPMEYRWGIIRERLKLPGYRIHDMRHTFATWSRRAIGLVASMALTGHKTISAALLYEHTEEDVLRKGAAAVAERAGLRNGNTETPHE
ncbi:MAG: tyrosine-type recombinase/integrase [Pigmentiphaga sp.]